MPTTKLEKFQLPNIDKNDVGLNNVLNIQQHPAIFWVAIISNLMASPFMGYIINGLGTREVDLPTSSAIGDMIFIMGNQADGWAIKQNASQKIRMGEHQTTPGTSGSLQSSNQYDQVTLVCIETNTTWRVFNPQGNLLLI